MGASNPDRIRLEHEKALAIQALRELEFDREMRKLSERIGRSSSRRLEARALRAMAALEKLDQKDRRQDARWRTQTGGANRRGSARRELRQSGSVRPVASRW